MREKFFSLVVADLALLGLHVWEKLRKLRAEEMNFKDLGFTMNSLIALDVTWKAIKQGNTYGKAHYFRPFYHAFDDNSERSLCGRYKLDEVEKRGIKRDLNTTLCCSECWGKSNGHS